jgi:hypothetical protein
MGAVLVLELHVGHRYRVLAGHHAGDHPSRTYVRVTAGGVVDAAPQSNRNLRSMLVIKELNKVARATQRETA